MFSSTMFQLDNQELRFNVEGFNEFMNRNFDLIGNVTVEGEITQLNVTPKGGANIVIKDSIKPAVLNLSGYAPYIEGIKLVSEGMKVAAWGKPNIWSQGGKFTLKIFKILPLGEGALKEAYDKLKEKLSAEGIFDLERKRPLPEYIQSVALLTGLDSAAQSDFVKILQENRAGFNVDFYPVQVQGKYAEREIIATLKHLDYKKYDCIALIRGGGSLEDLSTFNSENLARTLFGLPIPVIVGVGHEKDESIADFVADVRASTPSQAAYYLISNNQKFLDRLDLYMSEIGARINSQLSSARNKVSLLTSSIAQKLTYRLNAIRNTLNMTIAILPRLPRQIEQSKILIIQKQHLLNSLNPRNVLLRGYSLARNSNGLVIKSTGDVRINETISIDLSDGRLTTNILDKNTNGSKKKSTGKTK